MTKQELVKQISAKTGLSFAQVEVTIEAFVQQVKGNVAHGTTISMSGFGTSTQGSAQLRKPGILQQIL